MKQLNYLLIILLIASCSSIKRAEKSMNAGDHTKAFDILLNEYKKGLSTKKLDKFLPVFQKAYMRMISFEEAKIERLIDSNNPAYSGQIYTTFLEISNRQDRLKNLLPIYHKGRELKFVTKNYQPAIQQAKNDYLDYLYNESNQLLKNNDKEQIRKAYNNLKTIKELSPNYKNVNSLLEEAHYRGTDYILIKIQNNSDQIIPKGLEQELTELDTYGLDDFWTEYHSIPQKDLPYDYLIEMDFEHIVVSPERMKSQLHDFEREIIDGWEYLHENGELVLDDDGNPIKVDKIYRVSARVEEVIQEKDAYVDGKIKLIALENNQIVDTKKLHSEFSFRNHFAKLLGDVRAVDPSLQDLLRNRFMPFPSHEQMVYDCGEDIKKQLKKVLKRKF